MSGVAVIPQTSRKVGSPRDHLASEHLDGGRLAEHRITGSRGLRRKIRLVERAAQQGPSWHEPPRWHGKLCLLRPAHRGRAQQECSHIKTHHTVPLSLRFWLSTAIRDRAIATSIQDQRDSTHFNVWAEARMGEL